MTETANEPPEITDEQIYEALKQYEAAGVITFILPTEPLGEEWILGVPDGLGGLMKLKGKDQAVGWLAGAAVVAHWANQQHQPTALERFLAGDREPRPARHHSSRRSAPVTVDARRNYGPEISGEGGCA